MKPRRNGRLSRIDQLRQNDNWQKFYAAAADVAPVLLNNVPPKRDRIRRPVDGKPSVPLEKTVLADALQALRNDPRVCVVDRRQSGVFQEGERWIRVGTRGVLDISGMLRGGKYFELEAKRPGEKPDERQQARIELVKKGGGISGYFWSVETALALLS